MQLTLIQGTYAKPGNNIIAYHCMCPLEELHATQAAWQQVIEAEEIFRKDLRIEDGNGHLVDTENTPYRWRRAEVADRDALDDELRKPPSFRDVGFEFRIITMAGDDPIACILWHVHHAFIDGFSMQIILDKVSRVLAGQPIYPGPSFVTVASERNALIEERKAEAIEYWDSQKEVLDMAGGEMRLPRSAGADLSKNFWNHMATFTLNISQSQLGDYAHRHHVTVASIYYAAWALVLSIICDSDVVRMGVVMSGRSLPVSDILDVVGSLVNTLPLGIVVRKDVNTVAFICKVFQQLLELSTFDWSIPEHGYRRQFSSVLAMQFDVAGRTTHPSSMTSPSSRMNSDIPLSITVEADGTIHVQFSHEYDSEHINLLGTYFTRTIECLMRPAHTISMCLENILSLADRQTLLSYGNCLSGLTTESSVHDNLVVLMKHAAAKHPESCAANQGAQKMSYRELDQWSDSVATHLGVYVRQGDVVCVHANPSIYWLVAIYGILKAGAVYCPLNTNLNPGLRNSMFKSSGAAVYLTPLCSEIRYRPKGNRYAWAVEDLLQRQNEQEPDEFPHVMFPEANAYLCFTSGSTGKPKGVLCTHQGLVAFQKDLEVRLHAQPGRKIAQIMSVSFDGSIHEVFSALSYGATLALPDTNDPFAHLHEVDTCIFTPSLAARLDPTDYPNLSNVSIPLWQCLVSEPAQPIF
jgi:non-ribosomal peptide synthetase component F